MAYDLAAKHFVPGGTNRVILATDGDFNVGVTSRSELLHTVRKGTRNCVYLTILGYGMGNYKDSTLEKLADRGNAVSLREFRDQRVCIHLRSSRTIAVPDAGPTGMIWPGRRPHCTGAGGRSGADGC